MLTCVTVGFAYTATGLVWALVAVVVSSRAAATAAVALKHVVVICLHSCLHLCSGRVDFTGHAACRLRLVCALSAPLGLPGLWVVDSGACEQ